MQKIFILKRHALDEKKKRKSTFFIHLRVDLLGLSFEPFEPYVRKIGFLLRTKLLDLLSFSGLE